MISRSSLAQTVLPGLDKVFINSLKSVSLQYEPIFNIETADKMTEKDLSFYGFGLAVKKTEGNATAYADPGEGYLTSYTADTWSLAFRITREAYKDELYGLMAGMAKRLGLALRYTKNVNAANIFNNGFSDSYTSATSGYAAFGDAEPLFGDATAYTHPLKATGGTDKNRLATNADLDRTALKQALIDYRATLDDNGLLWMPGVEPSILVVHPELEDDALQLLRSEKVSEDATNATNQYLTSKKLRVQTWDFITDTDSFYLGSEKSLHQLKMKQREPIQTEAGDDFDTGNMKYKAFERYTFGWSDWRGWFGCPGC